MSEILYAEGWKKIRVEFRRLSLTRARLPPPARNFIPFRVTRYTRRQGKTLAVGIAAGARVHSRKRAKKSRIPIKPGVPLFFLLKFPTRPHNFYRFQKLYSFTPATAAAAFVCRSFDVHDFYTKINLSIFNSIAIFYCMRNYNRLTERK